MHYNLLFNGCSVTFGAELQGITNDKEHQRTHRFSHLVAEHFRMSYENISKSGISNDWITEKTIEWFEQGNTCDIAIIQFTIKSRIMWYDDEKEYNLGIRKDTTNNKSNLVSNLYYKTFYSDMIGNKNACKDLFILEQYFEKKNIKYILIEVSSNEKEFIKFNNFWGDMCKTKELKNILDIVGKSRENYCKDYKDRKKYPGLTGAHPSELGHQKIAKYLIEQINTTKN
jgi:hypothetical protein